jgi:predicted O-methyltransferase YrrM
VLEFGSGMSTLWFARRCKLLVSIETDRHWYEQIRSILQGQAIGNVDYRFSTESETLSEYEDSSFDFVLVDGYNRDVVMKTAIAKVRLGGYIYLDNSDVPYREYQTARQLLLTAAGAEREIYVFNDLSPTQVCVSEGTLAAITNK